MPFESFLHKNKSKRGILFHATIACSVFVHAGALAWATVQSITNVEELPAPQVKLTFMRAPLLAAPPKPFAGPKASGPTAKPAVKRDVRPRPILAQPVLQPPVVEKNAVAAPPPVEEPKPMQSAPVAAEAVAAAQGGGGVGTGPVGSPNGGGSAAGSAAASASGTGGSASAPRKMLPEALGKLQRLSGAPPAFPPQLAKDGSLFVVMTKVCVSVTGSVDSVELMKRADPLLDRNVVEAVRGWRYRPLISGANAVPYCTFVRFEFRTQ